MILWGFNFKLDYKKYCVCIKYEVIHFVCYVINRQIRLRVIGFKQYII